jgi:signal transduction histidine kinase
MILLVLATTSLVLVAFLLPLAVLVRSAAIDRAVNAAVVQAQALAPEVDSTDDQSLAEVVDQANADGGFLFTVFLPGGARLGAPAPRSAAVATAMTGTSLTAAAPGGREVLIAVAGRSDGTAVIRTFVGDAALSQGVARAWLVLGMLGLGLLGFSVLVAAQLARAVVRPLTDVVAVSHRLAGGDLAARARLDGPPEARAVGAGLNLLAQRIGALLAHERETAADLSHRLRTPLTALRIDVESVRDPVERERLTADVEHLTRTVDAVIKAARAPAPEDGVQFCDAAEVVAERVRFWSVLADEEGREVTVGIESGPIPVRMSRDNLSTVLDALLGNVFAHTPERTRFAVELAARASGGARLVISDTGPGLPASPVPARGSSAGGSTGLGLDIVSRAAAESGGRLILHSPPGGGATATVELGAAPGAARPPRLRPAHAMTAVRRAHREHAAAARGAGTHVLASSSHVGVLHRWTAAGRALVNRLLRVS